MTLIMGNSSKELEAKQNLIVGNEMGKRRKEGATPWKRCKKPKEDKWQSEGALIRENPKFEEYYRLQKIVPDEEFEQFMACLVSAVVLSNPQKTDLPTTFRIHLSDPYGEVVKRTLETKFHFEGTVQLEGKQVEAVHPLAWFPNENAWEVGATVG